MKLKDFTIGKFFYMSGKKYKCTDIGSRVIVAILWNIGESIPTIISSRKDGQRVLTKSRRIVEKRDLSGPPYLNEIVIFEYDLPACYPTLQKWWSEVGRFSGEFGKAMKARNKRLRAKPDKKEFFRAGWPIRSPK